MQDVALAIAVASVGAGIVRDRFGTDLDRFDKGRGDFATNADMEAEENMVALLKGERPSDAILGEEKGSSGAAASLRTWLIDPLCGTLNYAAKMRVVAVNVALRVGDKFVAAAVADPFNDEILWTDGRAAFLRAGEKADAGRDRPLRPDAKSRLVDLNFDPPFPNGPAFTAMKLAADPEFAAAFRPRVVSSTMALSWVASGQRAAYVTDGDLRDSVHFAAGLTVCESAGCTLTDLRGQSWGRGSTGLIAAADRGTHAALLRLVEKYLAC